MATIGSDYPSHSRNEPSSVNDERTKASSQNRAEKKRKTPTSPSAISDRYEPAASGLKSESSPTTYGNERGRTPSARASKASGAYYEERARETAKRHEREKEAIVQNYRKQIAEARESRSSDETEETNEYREKIRKSSEKAVKEARAEALAERRRAREMAENYDHLLKDKERKSTELLHDRLRSKDESNARKLEQAAERNRVSRETELQPLRQQVKETFEMRKGIQKEKNLARQSTIQELESDWNAKYQNQSESHEREKERLKNDLASSERVFQAKLGSFMKDKDRKTSDLISKQNLEHHERLNDVTQEYRRAVDQVRLDSTKEKLRSESLLTRERERASERQNEALSKQAESFQKTIQDQKTSQEARIDLLQRSLAEKSTTSDPSEISAAAEESIRRNAEKEFGKTLRAETERNSIALERMRENHADQLAQARQDGAVDTAGIHREHLRERAAMRETFVQHITDVEEEKRLTLSRAEDSNRKLSESHLRQHARSTQEMRRRYEEIIAERELEQSERLREVRNQAEFENRALRREFERQSADMVSTYQKRLDLQKAEFESKLAEMKAKLDTQARQHDRELKKTLSEQARSYEHRISAMEAQMKDRERTLARNHEDELEKVRKANALLLSKKG